MRRQVQPKRLKSERGAAKYKNIWLLGNGLCFENKLQKETFYCFPLLGISKQQQEDIAVSPQYWARAAASKVVEQQASSKISNFPFWFSQNQKTNSILRKGFEIENSLAVMSPLNSQNKGPYKRSFWFQHLWYYLIIFETRVSLPRSGLCKGHFWLQDIWVTGKPIQPTKAGVSSMQVGK